MEDGPATCAPEAAALERERERGRFAFRRMCFALQSCKQNEQIGSLITYGTYGLSGAKALFEDEVDEVANC